MTRLISPGLAGGEALLRIEAPDAFEQALAAQHLVAAGDAAVKIVRHVEKSTVAVGYLGVEREQFGADRAGRDRRLDAREQFHRGFGPHAPVAEQPALDAQHDFLAVALHHERRDQIEDDVIIVAGVQRDAFFRARLDHSAHDIERAVAVERRHLDRHDIVDPGQAAPERGRQVQPAHRRLQVEAHHGNLGGDGAAMGDEFVLGSAFHGGERQQPRVVTQVACYNRFAPRLPVLPASPAIMTSGRLPQDSAVSMANCSTG